MDLMAGDDLRMTFHSRSLPQSLFRVMSIHSYISASVQNGSYILLSPLSLSTPCSAPTNCSHTTMAVHTHSNNGYALDYERVCMYVWEPASVVACMYAVVDIRGIFALSNRFPWRNRPLHCYQRQDRMDLMPVDILRMTFHDVCLPLSLFRVLKGRNPSIYRCSSIGGHRTYIHSM